MEKPMRPAVSPFFISRIRGLHMYKGASDSPTFCLAFLRWFLDHWLLHDRIIEVYLEEHSLHLIWCHIPRQYTYLGFYQP